jgi:hypothetical protein
MTKFLQGELVELATNIRADTERGAVHYYSAGHQFEVVYSDGQLAKVKDTNDGTKLLVSLDDLQRLTLNQDDDAECVHVGRSKVLNGK